jgi:glycosyltransferase involved in cell wall biosynthesis
MKIAIDAAILGHKPITGLGVYARNLVHALSIVDKVNQYSIYSLRLHSDDLYIQNNNFRIQNIPDLIKVKSLWYSWALWNYCLCPLRLIKDRPDIFVSLIPALPAYCPAPRIFVMHDISQTIVPDSHLFRSRVKRKLDNLHAIKYANRIVADSNSTRDGMIKYLRVDPSLITVIYPGYDNKLFIPVKDDLLIDKILQKYGINGNYILYTGNLEPWKNLVRLIQAFIKLRKSRTIRHKLVAVGAKGWLYNDIFRLARESGMEQDIIFTGYVENQDLPVLYSGADVFVYPSLYEGFGLPPLEAMACGTPVITSNISSLPEVVGDAGVLVDPYKVDEIAEAMYRVISDQTLREDMVRKGLQRVKIFSWEKAAREMLQIIKSIVID